MTTIPGDCDSSDSLPHSSRTHVYKEFPVKLSLLSPSVPQTAPDLQGHHMNTAIVPEAPVVRLTSGPGLHGTVWLLEVRCPYCARTHVHGGGIDRTQVADFLGHRVSHCGRTDPDGVGYTLTDPDGVLR